MYTMQKMPLRSGIFYGPLRNGKNSEKGSFLNCIMKL